MAVYGGSSPYWVRSLALFTLTGDRSLIVLGGSDSGSLCTLNPATGQPNCIDTGRAFVHSVAPTPDGKSLLMAASTGSNGIAGTISVYDSKTLSLTATFPVAGDTSGSGAMIVSPDSRTMFIGDGQGVLYGYDIATGTKIGWMPSLALPPMSGGAVVSPINNPDPQAMSSSGLLAGTMEQGVGLLDTTALGTGAVGSSFLNDYIVPATGPTAGGTPIEFADEQVQPVKLNAVYVGGNTAAPVSQGSAEFLATTPAGSPGPADVYAFMTDGGMLIVPEGFSYGPTILEVAPGAATAEGGGTGIVFGYGFGSTSDIAKIPTDLQITVGGKQAVFTAYGPNAYGKESPPFNLQAAAYTIPPGAAGKSVDVTVTTGAGTTTTSGGMQYLSQLQQFPLQGAALVQGIYDARRDLYYFTDASQIRVFSRTGGQWLSPIQVPAAPSGTAHRLWGIALSPDGSKLAVGDEGAAEIYLLNPDSPGSALSFPTSNQHFGSLTRVMILATGLAVSNSGVIYFAGIAPAYSNGDDLFKLDTNSGTFKEYGVGNQGNAMVRTAISSDNSTVYFNNLGVVSKIDTATDSVAYASDYPPWGFGDNELTMSANQDTVDASSFIYDASLNAESYLVLSDRDVLYTTYVYGAKLSADGSLLFQPSTNGIDVFDGRFGKLRTRISLPVALSQNFDALVGDGKDNTLIAITGQTGTGIAIIDLSSLTEPSPLPYETKKIGLESGASWGNNTFARPPMIRPATAGSGRRPVSRAVIPHATSGLPLRGR